MENSLRDLRTGHEKLAARVTRLERQMQQQQHSDEKQRLDTERKHLEQQLALVTERLQLLKERDLALSERDAAVSKVDSVLARANYATIGNANYGDLEKLSSDERRRLQMKLHEFSQRIFRMNDVDEWSREIPSGLKRLLEGFSIRYQDSAGDTNDSPSTVSAIKAACDDETGVMMIKKNRAYWCNRHQNCLLVMQALTTIQLIQLWLK